MALFGLFAKKKTESVALIEIGASSVGGAYACFTEEASPLLAYSKRIPIEVREGEQPVEALKRSLASLDEAMVQEGAPILRNTVGESHISNVLLSIDAPWQETSVRTERVERAPFIFTRGILNAALAKGAERPAGKVLADESVVGTALDGYVTRAPLGKRASFASMIILSSFVPEDIYATISQSMHTFFHTRNIKTIAATSLRYQVLKTLFPHDEDYLFIDHIDGSLVTALVRHKLLVTVEHEAIETSGIGDPLDAALQKSFESITTHYPLPRTVFLIAPESAQETLSMHISSPQLNKLRLSQEQPHIVVLTSSQLTSSLTVGKDAVPDLDLGLMALFWKNRDLSTG